MPTTTRPSRIVAAARLRSLGHECTIVGDGATAWEAVQASMPDVVISDWMMPGLTGLELCRLIRAGSAERYVYFILVTGKESHEQIVEGMTAGADDYLLKPLRADDLEVRLIAASRVTAVHRELAEKRNELGRLNTRLAAQARSDPLTGLHNRLALQEDLQMIEARVARYAHRYCMALLDVDRFKPYNDLYGHPAGDRALRAVAREINAQSRGGDSVYRYGGEEFLCILPEQSLPDATIALERMRAAIEQLDLTHTGNLPYGVVTISAGVAVLDSTQPRSVDEVLKEADEALYRSKQLGRNRVEGGATSRDSLFEPEPQPEPEPE